MEKLEKAAFLKQFVKCEACGTWHWLTEACPPEFAVSHEGGTRAVRARSHEEAALKYGRRYDLDDNALIDNTIRVEVEKNSVVKRFEVSAEVRVNYSANEIK